jgi:hypothetical protein
MVMISRWQKCRPIGIDGEIARIDLVSESRNVQQMISWVHRFWNSHESNSGILSGEIGQAITAMQSPAQLSQKRRYGRGFHAVSAHLMNISENVEESFSFRGCFLEAGFFFFGGTNAPFSPKGCFRNTLFRVQIKVHRQMKCAEEGGCLNREWTRIHANSCSAPVWVRWELLFNPRGLRSRGTNIAFSSCF